VGGTKTVFRGGHHDGGWVRWVKGAIANVSWATGDEVGRAVARPSPPTSDQALKSGPLTRAQRGDTSPTTPDRATSQCTPSNQARTCGSGPIMRVPTLVGPMGPHGSSVQCTSWEQALHGCERATWVVVCARIGPRLSFHSSSVPCADWPTSTSAGKTKDVEVVSAMFSNPTAGHRNRQ